MENPILVEIYRGGILESFHRGVVCVVDENKKVVFENGNIHQICFPRSAMKLIQVLPLIELGGIERFGFTLEEIALMCGSHNAESEHLRVLHQILEKIACTPNDLNCGAQSPTSKKAADALLLNHEKPSQIHNNCSGKHAGMLALCKLINAPINGYLNPEHPIQQLILSAVEDLYEYPKNKMVAALDGCSAPIYSIPVLNQAIAYQNLNGNKEFSEIRNNALNTIRKAISEHPFMVAGSKRYCTDMMQITAPKVIGKTGAEGIFCMTFTDKKWGICIKIDDGKMQPQYHVAQKLIEASGIFEKDVLKPLESYSSTPLFNFNKLRTGEMIAVQLNF